MIDRPTVIVPASTANLGPGLDVLGLALDLLARAGLGEPSSQERAAGGRTVDDRHPAAVAFAAAGGHGPIWVRAPIPMGRGLGYSGAVRVAGALLALVQRGEVIGEQLSDVQRREVLGVVAPLEGHADNAAASLHGGLVVVSAGEVVGVPMVVEPAIVVWVPDGVTTSTDRSRATLPATVGLGDAVHNIGRTALLVAALAAGRTDLLDRATDDRLHQPHRLPAAGDAAMAIDAGRSAGAWAGWLSGSGPSVAFASAPDRVDGIAAALPSSGHVKVLGIDTSGARVRSSS